MPKRNRGSEVQPKVNDYRPRQSRKLLGSFLEESVRVIRTNKRRAIALGHTGSVMMQSKLLSGNCVITSKQSP
jgi:hypothetical protein